MGVFVRLILISLFIFSLNLSFAHSNFVCEEEATSALQTFMEEIHGTTISGARVSILRQSRKHSIYRSTFKIEYQGASRKQKKSPIQRSGLKNRAGIVLLSHKVALALPSPLTGLTSEFEMGSGVSPSLSTPTSF